MGLRCDADEDRQLMRIAVPAELDELERRVAMTPASAAKLAGDGHEVVVETGAGLRAGFDDGAYVAAGATVANRIDTVGTGGVVVKIHSPRHREAGDGLEPSLGSQHALVALLDPLWHPDLAAELASTGCAVFALDLVPRITRAQTMDVLSSMATVAGYQAALLAASRLPKMLPLMMTAAGTIPAARILVLGAGVAGLQAIATSRRLGAVVEGYDIRPAATEQIRSLGAKAIELQLDAAPTETSGGYAREQTAAENQRQHELLAPHAAEADAVITTAAVPGATSPELITPAMVEAMAPGSVIVDLAAERGGNCRLTKPDEEVTVGGVTILGPTDLASRSPATSSQLFAGNIVSFLRHLAPGGELVIDREDEITAGTLIGIGGELVHPDVVTRLGGGRDRSGVGS
jgi:NAD(P) transhydrogenase subunit alpha